MNEPIEIHEKDKPIAAEITAEKLIITLGDGRMLGVPLNWYPFLAQADRGVLQNFTLLPNAIFWEALDDGISIRTLLLDIQQGKLIHL